jgi:hypothetical protein
MNVNASTAAPIPAAANPGIEEKRVTLQALLLKKSLESQMSEAAPTADEQGGKGRLIDLRV